MTDYALPAGALVLVTGVNGYIASHVADQLLELGYGVRGTARDETKVNAIVSALKKKYPSANIEGVVVADMKSENAFHEAAKGCAGVVHVASDLSFSPDPNAVVPGVVQGTFNALKAAQDVGASRFVLTSSSIAAVMPKPNTKLKVDENSWNEEAVEQAWAPPPYESSRAMYVYGASKVAGEREAWKFVKEQKPNFILNAVLPNMNTGPKMYPDQPASTGGWMEKMYNGNKETIEQLQNFTPQYAVDVRDDAALHVAALLFKDVKNERILAFAEAFNYGKLRTIMQKLNPSLQLPGPLPNEGEDISEVATARADELLRKLGRPGFTGLEASLKAQLVG